MKIKTKDTFGNTNEYEVVEKMPNGYFVWNIGANMGTDEYIPIAEWKHPGNKENYDINPDTVKAIKMDPADVRVLRKASGYGISDYTDAKRAIARNPKSGYMRNKKELAEKAMKIFEKITA